MAPKFPFGIIGVADGIHWLDVDEETSVERMFG